MSSILLIAAMAGAAEGCPVCDSATGVQVREGVLDENLPIAVMATVLPFVVAGGLVAAVHYGWCGFKNC